MSYLPNKKGVGFSTNFKEKGTNMKEIKGRVSVNVSSTENGFIIKDLTGVRDNKDSEDKKKPRVYVALDHKQLKQCVNNIIDEYIPETIVAKGLVVPLTDTVKPGAF